MESVQLEHENMTRLVLGCETEVAEATNGVSDELKSERIMRLSWALVHSKQPEDVQRGIAMLETSLPNSGSPLQKREKLIFLLLGITEAVNMEGAGSLQNNV
ncbi:hypothetical protein ACSBR2_035141 [Camellia fascicularis]